MLKQLKSWLDQFELIFGEKPKVVLINSDLFTKLLDDININQPSDVKFVVDKFEFNDVLIVRGSI